MFLYLNYKNH